MVSRFTASLTKHLLLHQLLLGLLKIMLLLGLLLHLLWLPIGKACCISLLLLLLVLYYSWLVKRLLFNAFVRHSVKYLHRV